MVVAAGRANDSNATTGQAIYRAALLALLVSFAAAGCVSMGPRPIGEMVELDSVPFFADGGTLCGPSALAAWLGASGVEVSAAALQESVYLPGRGGTLQAEMLAGARGHDRLPVRLAKTDQALVSALQSGYAVLILQNLGVSWAPAWHYAVVVGYLPASDTFVLRSSTTRRKLITRRRLLMTWNRSDRWAHVLLVPGEVPEFLDRGAYLTGAAALESAGRLDAAARAYTAGIARWPEEPLFALGRGNVLAGQKNWAGSANAYSNLLDREPHHVLALNNLSHVLGQGGCPRAALHTIRRAARLADSDPALTRMVRTTAKELEAARSVEAGVPAIRDCSRWLIGFEGTP